MQTYKNGVCIPCYDYFTKYKFILCIHILFNLESNTELSQRLYTNTLSFCFKMVCDADCKLINCVAEWPDCTHDSRVFRNSEVCDDMENVE